MTEDPKDGPELPPGPPEPPPVEPPPVMPGPPERPGLPWERPEGRSLSSALETLKLVLLQPAEAFAMMRRGGALSEPLLYLLVFGVLGTFFGLLWQSTMRSFFGRLADADLAEIAAINSFGVVTLLMAPVFVLLFWALMSVIIHLGLMAFGGAPHPLETTLRSVFYSSGSTYVFMILPFCGGFISFFWWLVVQTIALREAQGVPGGRAVAAVLAPIVLVCCCCALIWFAFAATIMSVVGNMQ